MPSIVREELGPTLPELLRPLPRALRLTLLALAALPIVLLLAWGAFGRGTDIERVVVSEQPSFNLGYMPPFARQPTAAGELVRLGHDDQFLSVRRLRLPAYRGDAAGFLPVYASGLADRLERRPGVTVRGEGRANINQVQGYELTYVERRPGQPRTYGRQVMLLPEPTAREGVLLTLEAPAGGAIANPDSVGRYGALKVSLRSFRFGTEAP